jgi:hypothetical protein
MNRKLKTTLVALLLLSLALTGCVVDAGRGYGDRGWGDRGWGNPHHSEYRGEPEQYRVWVR